MVAAFAFAAFLATSPVAPTADKAAAQIAAIEKRIDGRVGVAMLGNGRPVENRPNERFPMCSTFKLLAAAAVLQRVDRGHERLDRFVRYGQADILEYAPVTKKHRAEGGMKLGDLCAAAIEQSDNTAGNLLLRTIGGPAGLTKFARALGDRETRLDRTEPELNTSIPGDLRDTTTPAAICDDLRKLLTTDVLSRRSREQLESWLRANETGQGMIRAGIPSHWKVGDKTGRSGNGTMNDIAILRPPNRPPIFLAIYTAGSSAAPPQQMAALAEIARVVTQR